MIVSASRRTDLPAFYAPWFLRRLEQGWCRVPNPRNPRQVSTVSLRAEDVDAFVFWTRRPEPFLPALDRLDRRGDAYCFLFTLTGYGPPLEPRAPSLEQGVASFLRLSRRLGPERVVWRYDPLLFGPGLEPDDHQRRFRSIARRLEGATLTVKTSFLDLYRKTRRRLARLGPGVVRLEDPASSSRAAPLLASLARAAAEHGMRLETCAEDPALLPPGVEAGRCIDTGLLARAYRRPFPAGRDKGQRALCLCAPSRDIGRHDTCLHGCAYCYAVSSHDRARQLHRLHDPEGPSLVPLQGPHPEEGAP